jgi:dTDP-4-amino-4,6-dideoxygalactose transaminase
MTDIQASIGLVELDRYEDDMLTKREYIFNRYSSAFSEHEWAQIPEYHNETKKSSFHAYLLRIKGITENDRNTIIQSIFDEGVAVNVHYTPLPMMSYYKSIGYEMLNFPVSYDNFSREISLPVFYDLDDEKIEIVIDSVIKSAEKFFSLKKSLI